MKPTMKRVAAIHDLSGFGRASLCSIIPTLSSMGIQVCPVPTAILSTHSGGFREYTFEDLTDTIPAYMAHWKKLNLHFDCIYSGFLGSPVQTQMVADIFDDFADENTLVVVDPVMGDNGGLYSSIPESMVPQMRRLVNKADIIVPNYTEAALLLDEDVKGYRGNEELKEWLRRLSDLGPDTVLITSAPDEERPEMMNVIAYEKESDTYWKVASRLLHDYYPGTGDIFASVMIGSLLKGESLPGAIDWAAQFVSQCIKVSSGYDYERRDGVQLERVLPLLHQDHLINGYERF
ncbi:MAG TPA: pyridoxamine kinase [Candidatus Blautia intestinigallinarum]|nr:pyridoxamine kinase [Candidatus Blautia intestinigallinarum]